MQVAGDPSLHGPMASTELRGHACLVTVQDTSPGLKLWRPVHTRGTSACRRGPAEFPPDEVFVQEMSTQEAGSLLRSTLTPSRGLTFNPRAHTQQGRPVLHASAYMMAPQPWHRPFLRSGAT